MLNWYLLVGSTATSLGLLLLGVHRLVRILPDPPHVGTRLCGVCGYIVDNLPTPICPECGTDSRTTPPVVRESLRNLRVDPHVPLLWGILILTLPVMLLTRQLHEVLPLDQLFGSLERNAFQLPVAGTDLQVHWEPYAWSADGHIVRSALRVTAGNRMLFVDVPGRTLRGFVPAGEMVATSANLRLWLRTEAGVSSGAAARGARLLLACISRLEAGVPFPRAARAAGAQWPPSAYRSPSQAQIRMGGLHVLMLGVAWTVWAWWLSRRTAALARTWWLYVLLLCLGALGIVFTCFPL